MQTRSFTSLDLVRLPRLDAKTAQSLATAVVAAADKHGNLSEGAREMRDEVSVALKLLIEASTQRLPNPDTENSPRAKAIDIQVDAAWGGTYNWLNGWARLPDEPKAKIAADLRERLFPDGLKFTQLRYAKQWAESNTRLSLIDEAELHKSFDALGGITFLETLRATHQAYGDVLGITKAQDEEAAQAVRVRDALDQLADALRDYVLQVSAMARKSNPDSQALVDKLLAPITNWQSGPVAKASPAQATTEPVAGEDGEGDCAK